jgi:alkylation response protein AidB-like acyl-CoA dehydrogenase
LKDKIGAHILPTAELSLESTEGYLLGKLNKGVKHILPVLNITRIYSAFGGLGNLRKCLAIATSYSTVRNIYVNNSPQLLSNTPLHVSQLTSINVTYRALTHFTFGVVRLMGKIECGTANQGEEARLRLLTSVLKAFVSEKSVAVMEDAMTALGGAGYMEENAIGRYDCCANTAAEN